jgi:hypothetical protein
MRREIAKSYLSGQVAESVIGRRVAPTGWLAMTVFVPALFET